MSIGENYRKEAESLMEEGGKLLKLLQGRPSAIFERLNGILATIPVDGDDSARQRFNFGILRMEIEEAINSEQGSTDSTVVLAATALASARMFHAVAGIADLMEAQVGGDAIRQSYEKKKERAAFNSRLNLALGRGDYDEHDKLVAEFNRKLAERSAAIVNGGTDAAAASGESADEGGGSDAGAVVSEGTST